MNRFRQVFEWSVTTIAIGLFAVIIVSLVYVGVVLHDPAKAAAFDPCNHSKVHKRPARCTQIKDSK